MDCKIIEKGVTQSLLERFQRCKCAASLSLRGIRASEESVALTRGTLVHDALAIIRRNMAESRDNLKDVVEYARLSVVQKAAEIASNASSEELATDINNAGSIAAALVVGHFNKWYSFDAKMKWVFVEKSFEVMYNGVKLRGKMDGLVEVKPNQYYIVETKTHSDLPSTIDLSLQLSFQNMFYIVGAGELGIHPIGVIQDMLRVPQLRMKKGKKGEEPETPDAFQARMLEDIDVRKEFYFNRFEIAYPKEDIARFKEDLQAILSEYKRWSDEGMPPNRSYRCVTRGTCEYAAGCVSRNFDNYGHDVNPFRELEEQPLIA